MSCLLKLFFFIPLYLYIAVMSPAEIPAPGLGIKKIPSALAALQNRLQPERRIKAKRWAVNSITTAVYADCLPGSTSEESMSETI